MYWMPLEAAREWILRRDIAAWWDDLHLGLQQALAAHDTRRSTLCPLFNQFALLATWQGEQEAAARICQLQIDFWQRLAVHKDEPALLGAVLQPWINLARLARWRQQLDASQSLYFELAPQQRTQQGSLAQRHGVPYTLQQICEFDPAMRGLLDAVYWCEYGRLLLQTGQGAALGAHLQAGLNLRELGSLRLQLLELLILQQARQGKGTQALDILQRLRLPQADLSSRLVFTVWRIALQKDEDGAQALLAQFADANQFVCEGGNLNLLSGVVQVWRGLGWQAEEAATLQQLQRWSSALGDQMVSFEVTRRYQELGQVSAEEVSQRFADSRYRVIRQHLQLGPLPAEAGAQVQQMVQVLEALAQLDWAMAQDLLPAAPQLAELAA